MEDEYFEFDEDDRVFECDRCTFMRELNLRRHPWPSCPDCGCVMRDVTDEPAEL